MRGGRVRIAASAQRGSIVIARIVSRRSGPVTRRLTLETGHGDRAANMETFAAAMLDAFLDALTEADRAP